MFSNILVPPALIAGIIGILEAVKALLVIFGVKPDAIPSKVWRIVALVLGFAGAILSKFIQLGAIPVTVDAWVEMAIFGWVVAMAAGKAYDESLGKARDKAKLDKITEAVEPSNLGTPV